METKDNVINEVAKPTKSQAKRIKVQKEEPIKIEVPAQNVAKVTIEKSKLDSLIEKVEKQDKQIGMLVEVADKARMHRFESANKDFSQKVVKVSTYNGKIVVAWKLVKDEMYQNAAGKWVEDQQVGLSFIDNTKEVVSYMDFVRKLMKVDGTLKKRYSTPEGENMMRIDVADKTIDLNESYIN